MRLPLPATNIQEVTVHQVFRADLLNQIQEAARSGHSLDHQGRLPEPQQRPHTLCVIREDQGVAVIELSTSSALALNGIAAGLSLQEALMPVDDEQLRIEMLAYWIRLPLFSALEVAA